jgi:hypothetical protein
MGKKATTDFEKKHGFAAPLKAHLEGHWEAFFMRVEATLTCKDCGATLHLSLKGAPTKLSERQIGQRVLAVAQRRHECPAVTAQTEAHLDKYFSDLRRGMEKKHEIDYRREKGTDGKFTHKA